MNLEQGLIAFQACTCGGFDWHAASKIVNGWTGPLVWVDDQLLDLAQVPVLGAITSFLYPALLVIEGFLAAALVAVMVIVVNTWAAIAASVVSEFGQLTQMGSTIAHALNDDGWGPLISGTLVAQLGLIVIAVVVARRLFRGRRLAFVVCAIGLLLGLGPLLRMADALRVLGV